MAPGLFASRILLPVVLVLGTAHAPTMAQGAPPRTVTFALPTDPGAAALQKHDLAWITTGNDFSQDGLDAAAIDSVIAQRIRAYDRETAIVTFDVPINSRRLSGPVQKKYVQFNPAIAGLTISNTGGALDRNAYFWRYGDIDIAVPGDTYKDQLNVYAVARAIEILRYRYGRAYQRLFVAPRNFPPGTPALAAFKNRNSVLLISFDESPDYIAAGATALGSANLGTFTSVGGFGESSNVAVVSIDNTNVQGVSASGSQPLYLSSAEENYVRYLREGLVESLVHEMLHRYVNYRYSYDPIYNFLYKGRGPFLATSAEEAVVTTTSLQYFVREGGLQGNVLFYYRGLLDSNIQYLTVDASIDRYTALIDPSAKHVAYKDRLRLDVLN